MHPSYYFANEIKRGGTKTIYWGIALIHSSALADYFNYKNTFQCMERWINIETQFIQPGKGSQRFGSQVMSLNEAHSKCMATLTINHSTVYCVQPMELHVCWVYCSHLCQWTTPVLCYVISALHSSASAGKFLNFPCQAQVRRIKEH